MFLTYNIQKNCGGVLTVKNPNGYGSVIKLGGNRRRPWAVRITTGWTDDGKQKYDYLGYYRSRPDAMIALAEYNKNPYDINAKKITFKEIYELWEDEYFVQSNRRTSDSLRRSYKAAYNNVEPLHDQIFTKIRSSDMQQLLNGLKLGKSSKNNIKLLLNQMYKYAMKNDIIEKNYAAFVSVYTEDEPNKRKPFTNDEIKLLWNNVDQYETVEFALIMIYTGLRIGELLALNKNDINIEDRFLTGGLKTDAGKDRIVPLNKKIVPFFERRLNNKGKYLFYNKVGGRLLYPAFMRHWKKDMKKLKLKHNPHDCRHTFATLMNNADANSVAIKRIMGHSIKDVTEGVYTHKDLSELIKAIDLI